MLRIEYKGQPYDWFNLDEMGEIVRTSDFSSTLRENIAHYFGVPFDCQAVYDEEGMLSSVSDFARALHSTRPWLRVHDIRDMDMDLQARTVQQLNEIFQDVSRSLRNFGVPAGGTLPQSKGGPREPPYDQSDSAAAGGPNDTLIQSWPSPMTCGPSPMTQRDSPVSLADAVRRENEERATSVGQGRQPYGSQREGVGPGTAGLMAGSTGGPTAGPPTGSAGATGSSDGGLAPNGFSQAPNNLSPPRIAGGGAPGLGGPGTSSFSSAPVSTWTGPAAYMPQNGSYVQPNGVLMNTFGATPGAPASWVYGAPPSLNMPTPLPHASSNGNLHPMTSSAYTGSPGKQQSLTQGLVPQLSRGPLQVPGLQQQPLLAPTMGQPMLGAGPVLRQSTPPPSAATGWPAAPLNGMVTCRSCGNTGVDLAGEPCTCPYGQRRREASTALGSASRSASPAPVAVGTRSATPPPNGAGGATAPSLAMGMSQAPVEVEVKAAPRNVTIANSAQKPLMRQLDVVLPEHQSQKDVQSVGSGGGAAAAALASTATAGGEQEAFDAVEVTISKDGGDRNQRFGFANVPTGNGRSLLVSWVDQYGLLARWNRTFPEKCISEGDRIVVVNSVKDDVEAMRDELQSDTIHMLVHRRSSKAC